MPTALPPRWGDGQKKIEGGAQHLSDLPKSAVLRTLLAGVAQPMVPGDTFGAAHRMRILSHAWVPMLRSASPVPKVKLLNMFLNLAFLLLFLLLFM